MEVRVKIEQIFPLESGVSQGTGKAWQKLSFVGQTFDRFPRKIFFVVLGDLINTLRLNRGEDYNVSFDIESRSFTDRNGVERWSTDIKVWKCEPVSDQTQQPAAQQQATQQQFQAPQPQYGQQYQQQPQYGQQAGYQQQFQAPAGQQYQQGQPKTEGIGF